MPAASTTADRYARGESISAPSRERTLVAEERLLDDVLRLRDAAEHAVGEREQQSAAATRSSRVRSSSCRRPLGDDHAAARRSPRRAPGSRSRQLECEGCQPSSRVPSRSRSRGSGSSSRPRHRPPRAARATPALAAAAWRPTARPARAATRRPERDRRRRCCRCRRPALDCGNGRRGRIVDVDPRPDACAGSDDRQPALAHRRDHRVRGAGAVEAAVAQHDPLDGRVERPHARGSGSPPASATAPPAGPGRADPARP